MNIHIPEEIITNDVCLINNLANDIDLIEEPNVIFIIKRFIKLFLNNFFFKNIFMVQSGGANDLFNLVNSSTRNITKFAATEYRYEIGFQPIDGAFDKHNARVIELFNQLDEFIDNKANSNDKVRVIFFHDDLHYPISTPLISYNQFQIMDIVNMIENVCQSKRTLSIDQNLSLNVLIVKMPQGSGNVINDYLLDSNCLKVIVNRDYMCAIRAVLVAKAFFDNDPQKNDLIKYSSTELNRRTLRVANATKLLNQPCTLDDIRKIEMYLQEYRISVYEGKNCIREGDKQLRKHLYLLYVNNHYHAITNIRVYLGHKYFCHWCLIGFGRKERHRECPMRCKTCNDQTCKGKASKILICEFCKQEANGQDCLIRHLNEVCRVANKCEVCNQFKSKTHVCEDEMFCSNCKQAVPKSTHRCFVLTEAEKNKSSKSSLKGYIFFDYEATQENTKAHVANLVCVVQLCQKCMSHVPINFKDISCVRGCGQRMFLNNNQFCDWLFRQKNYTAIAHNMKGIIINLNFYLLKLISII